MSKCFKQVSRFVSETINFSWKIEDFLNLDVLESFSIKSDIFSCLGTKWQLILYPNKTRNNQEAVVVELVYCEGSFQTCRASVGFENKFGSPFPSPLGAHELTEENRSNSFSRSTLTSESDIFLPDNTLNIFCNMKVSNLATGKMTTEIEKPQMEGTLKLSEDLQNALQKDSLSDILLKFEDGEFRGHKIILSCRSKVFHWKFEHMKNGEAFIRLGTTKLAGMDMIQYIYTGKFQALPLPRIFDLFDNAEAYDILELKRCCKNYLLENLSAENLCEVATFANSHNDKDIEAASALTLKENFKTVLNSEKWKYFAGNNPTLYTKLLEAAVLKDISNETLNI